MTQRRASRPNLLASAQAYLEYTAEPETTQDTLIDKIGSTLGRRATQLIQFPEFLTARRTLRTEWQRRGLGGDALTLVDFAKEVKQGIEHDLYDPIEYKATPSRLSAAMRDHDIPLARHMLNELSGTDALYETFEASKNTLWDEYEASKSEHPQKR